MRLSLIIGILIATTAVVAAQDCTDYGLYPRVIDVSDEYTWNLAIAVHGDYAVVAPDCSNVVVYDISVPGRLTTAGHFSSRANRIALTDSHAYLLTHDRKIKAYDMATPATPVLTSEHYTGLYMLRAWVVDTFLYVLGHTPGSELPSRLLVIDVSEPGHLGQVVDIELPSWGSDFCIEDERLYFLGIDNVLTTFDLSDPISPVFMNATAVDAYVTRLILAGGHAFLGGSELVIMDLQLPDGPVVVGRVAVHGPITGIVVRDDMAYLTVSNGGLTLVDIADLTAPAVIVRTNVGGWGLKDIVLVGDVAYVAGYRVSAIDISHPASPPILDTLPLDARATLIVVRDERAYLTDQASKLHVLDISDPTRLVVLGSVVTQNFPNDLALSGDIAVVATGPGVELFDVSDPTAPAPLGYHNDNYLSSKIVIIDDLVYRVGFSEGLGYTFSDLMVIDIGDPTSPALLTTLALPSGSRFISTRGSVAYIGGAANEVHLYDLAVPGQPQLIESLNIPGVFGQVVHEGNLAVSGHDSGLDIYNLADPMHPQHVGGLPTLTFLRGVAVRGSSVYVGKYMDGLRVIDIADPSSPAVSGWANVPFNTDTVTRFGDFILVAGTEGVQVLLPQCEGTVAIGPADDDPISEDLPAAGAWLAVYPNPFNPTTTISFAHAVGGHVRLEIVDLRGRLVATLMDEFATEGRHEVTWNGRTDRNGGDVASGVYLARLRADGRLVHQRMTLLR